MDAHTRRMWRLALYPPITLIELLQKADPALVARLEAEIARPNPLYGDLPWKAA